MDQELYSQQFVIEHKMFYVDLKANAAGYYLKISEKSGGRRHNVLIPISGLSQILKALQEAVDVAANLPPVPDCEGDYNDYDQVQSALAGEPSY